MSLGVAGPAAARLVADLMPIAVAVHGPGAASFVAQLQEAGADAVQFDATAGGAFDLAVLLAPARAPQGDADSPAIAALAAASDRLLFVPAPVPAGQVAAPDLDAWFELFAEHGFQPVVDYDAGFLGAGAFLVDRNATAAESELAAFAERVSLGGALAVSSERVAALEAEAKADADDRATLRATVADQESRLRTLEGDLAVSRADADAWRARAAAAEAELAGLRRQIAGWEQLGRWVWAACAQPARGTLAVLRAGLGTKKRRRGWLSRLRGAEPPPTAQERALLEDARLVRSSRMFDAAWYIASNADLAESGDDPVWHYVLRGAAAGVEPGPYFDSAKWREKYPDRNPLAEAVRQGEG
jgi:hypothetical protein